MNKLNQLTTLPLPKDWPRRIKSSMLQLFSLTKLTVATIQGQMVENKDTDPYQVRIGQLEHKVRLLDEFIRILADRMVRIPPHRRPRYLPIERMQILELKSLCGWSLRQTARRFLIAPATVSSWLKRVDEDGQDAIVRMALPVNKFPDFVRYAVQRLKILCPQLGKVKIAEILSRSGLHLAVTTVGRMLKQQPASDRNKTQDHDSLCHRAKQKDSVTTPFKTKPIVRANHPNHIWHVDLTAVSIGGGFWTAWFPFTLPQRWPFCWWVAVVMDHFSRKVIGFAVYTKQPTSRQVRTFLSCAISRANAKPKHLVSDKGKQFYCCDYKKWCRRKGIKPRYGAIGKHGSIAVIERLIRTFKEFTRSLTVVPIIQSKFRVKCIGFFNWYNEHRPHTTLKGKTPDEVYFRIKHSANRMPRIEPRKDWPRGSPCAKPRTIIAGKPGGRFTIEIEYQDGNRHLPVVTLNRAA